MAWVQSDGGSVAHATDHVDLLDLFNAYVTANGGVEVEFISGQHTILQLPGSGSDEILIGAQIYSNPSENNHAWILNGFTGYTNGQDWAQQLGNITYLTPALALWDTTIPYWFFVNDRRAIIVAKVGGTYQMAYLGWILPYGTPGQWAYPLVVGGTTYRADNDSTNLNRPYRYSVTRAYVSAFWNPLYSNESAGTLFVRTPSGWRQLRNQATGGSGADFKYNGTKPYFRPYLDRVRKSPGDVYAHHAIEIIDGQQPGGYLGVFDGMRFCPGEDLSPETIVSDASGDYIAFPNVFRTSENNWCLIKQE